MISFFVLFRVCFHDFLKGVSLFDFILFLVRIISFGLTALIFVNALNILNYNHYFFKK